MPMVELEKHLKAELEVIATAGLTRRLRLVDSPQRKTLRVEGRDVTNFSSNDYLGLANHPSLKEAARRALELYGTGSGASRLICGSLKPFHELEEALAAFKGTEAGLVFSSGYSAALGTIQALMDTDDIVIIDKLVHACLVDAARLSGAKLRVFKHNNLEDLERILKWADQQRSGVQSSDSTPNVLIVTESVFSMDGDLAPLPDIVALKEKYGAWLMVDDAHATGLFGENRSGLIGHTGMTDRVEIQMGTLGKAVGAGGGYICGSRTLTDVLVNKARSFIFSTAPAPAVAAAAKAGIELIQSKEGADRNQRAWKMARQAAGEFAALAEAAGVLVKDIDPGASVVPESSLILPLVLGDEANAVAVGEGLLERGFYVPAIRYPSVARGRARLRCTMTADHTAEDFSAFSAALKDLLTMVC